MYLISLKNLMIKLILFFLFFVLSQASYAGDISHEINKFGCVKFKASENYTESCYVSIQLHIKPETKWEKLACFGEVTFKQVYNGEVNDFNQGFLVSIIQDDGTDWSESFKVTEFIYFHNKALQPKLDWLQCRVIRP